MVKCKKKPAPKSAGVSLVGILLLASLAGNLYQYTHRAVGPDNVIVDDDKHVNPPRPAPKPDAVDLKECVLVTIVSKRTINEDVDYVMTMQDDAFWDEMQSKLADVEHMDEGDEPAKKWLEKANLQPPVVLLVNRKTQKVLWSMPLPKGGTKEIRSKLGQ